jgi:UDP:flavonoid glycosyltransferase YjiC (YdhE family)
MWEVPYGDVPLPDGDPSWPLVLVAPSTSQDPEQRLLRAAVEGLADEPVRVLATWNRRAPRRPLRRVGANTRLVEWVSYSRTMPRCDAVICHAGHGTMVRALASGCVVVAVPAAGDMNENAARLEWTGAGVRLPGRYVRPSLVRLALARALGDPRPRARARALAAWAQDADPGARAAELLEAMVT